VSCVFFAPVPSIGLARKTGCPANFVPKTRSYTCRIFVRNSSFPSINLASDANGSGVARKTLSPHQLLGIRTRMQVASNIGLGDTDFNQVSHLIVVRALGQVRELFSFACLKVVFYAFRNGGAYRRRVFALPPGRHLAKSLHNSMYVPPPNRYPQIRMWPRPRFACKDRRSPPDRCKRHRPATVTGLSSQLSLHRAFVTISAAVPRQAVSAPSAPPSVPEIVNWPLCRPVLFGAKLTSTATLCPGIRRTARSARYTKRRSCGRYSRNHQIARPPRSSATLLPSLRRRPQHL